MLGGQAGNEAGDAVANRVIRRADWVVPKANATNEPHRPRNTGGVIGRWAGFTVGGEAGAWKGKQVGERVGESQGGPSGAQMGGYMGEYFGRSVGESALSMVGEWVGQTLQIGMRHSRDDLREAERSGGAQRDAATQTP